MRMDHVFYSLLLLTPTNTTRGVGEVSRVSSPAGQEAEIKSNLYQKWLLIMLGNDKISSAYNPGPKILQSSSLLVAGA